MVYPRDEFKFVSEGNSFIVNCQLSTQSPHFRFSPKVKWANAEAPRTVDQTVRGASREKRGKKNKHSGSCAEPVLHLHGYYTAFSQKCNPYFVKSILSASKISFQICAYRISVNNLCPA